MWSTPLAPAASLCFPVYIWRRVRRRCGTSRPPWSCRRDTSGRAATGTATPTDQCDGCAVSCRVVEGRKLRRSGFNPPSDLHQELSGVKSTSSRLRLLLLIGPLLCPHFPPLTPPWSSPSTGPTTLPWYRIPSSRRCRATTSPCSCGCGGAEATSRRQPLRPEAVARRRRPSCAAPSETVRSMIPR